MTADPSEGHDANTSSRVSSLELVHPRLGQQLIRVALPPQRLEDKSGSVGIALDNLKVRIVDAEGKEVPPGESGELWVAGESVCAGYLDDPEETQRKFRDGWLATGDIASRDADGYLWITGRQGEFIKMRGVRVGFTEIETTIASVRGVVDCAAVAVPHEEAGEALALYVVAAQDEGDVAAAVRRRLPSEWTCDSVTLISQLPRNAHGKLLRPELEQWARGAPRAGEPGRISRRRDLPNEASST